MATGTILLNELKRTLNDDLLKRWYPLVVDREHGGYFTNITQDWKLPPSRKK